MKKIQMILCVLSLWIPASNAQTPQQKAQQDSIFRLMRLEIELSVRYFDYITTLADSLPDEKAMNLVPIAKQVYPMLNAIVFRRNASIF